MTRTGRTAGLLVAMAMVAVPMLHAAPAGATFPGKSGPIAYAKVTSLPAGESVDESGGLFTHGPRLKQSPRQLSAESGDHSPSYSPNGRLIVFVVDDEKARGDIYVMRSDGSERRQLTSGAESDSDPSFFPDGRRIVFSRSVGADNHIFTVDLDGSGLRPLTSGPYDDYDPVVSPNGRRIAFVSDRDPDERADRGDIFTMRPNGSGLRVLIDGDLYDYDPDYAPSGRRIAFASNRGPGLSNVFVARANGHGVRQLTPCRPTSARCRTYSRPVFAPDGRHIAMVGNGDAIDVMRSDGGNVRTFDSTSTEEEGFGSRLVGSVAWGPRP